MVIQVMTHNVRYHMRGQTNTANRYPTGAWFALATLAMWLGASGSHSHAQERLAGPDVQEIADGLFVITTSAGNTAARVTPEGVVLVHATIPGDRGALAAHLREISDRPLSHIVYTHHHRDGFDEGEPVPRRVKIVAHANTRRHLTQDGPHARPDVVFASTLSVFTGGVEVRVHHLGRGHTDGDAVVHFPDLRAIHTGDLVVTGVPFIDYDSGGSTAEWVTTLGEMLTLEFDIVIPGRGPILTRGDVQSFRDKLVTLRARMAQLIQEGISKEDVARHLVTHDLEWVVDPTGPFASESLPGLYDEISGTVRDGTAGNRTRGR